VPIPHTIRTCPLEPSGFVKIYLKAGIRQFRWANRSVSKAFLIPFICSTVVRQALRYPPWSATVSQQTRLSIKGQRERPSDAERKRILGGGETSVKDSSDVKSSNCSTLTNIGISKINFWLVESRVVVKFRNYAQSPLHPWPTVSLCLSAPSVAHFQIPNDWGLLTGRAPTLSSQYRFGGLEVCCMEVQTSQKGGCGAQNKQDASFCKRRCDEGVVLRNEIDRSWHRTVPAILSQHHRDMSQLMGRNTDLYYSRVRSEAGTPNLVLQLTRKVIECSFAGQFLRPLCQRLASSLVRFG